MLAVLAYSDCRVGGLVRLCVRDFKTSGEHRILNVTGKERTTPLHLEAVERLAAWLAVPSIVDNPARSSCRPLATRPGPRRLRPELIARTSQTRDTGHYLRLTRNQHTHP